MTRSEPGMVAAGESAEAVQRFPRHNYHLGLKKQLQIRRLPNFRPDFSKGVQLHSQQGDCPISKSDQWDSGKFSSGECEPLPGSRLEVTPPTCPLGHPSTGRSNQPFWTRVKETRKWPHTPENPIHILRFCRLKRTLGSIDMCPMDIIRYS